MTRQKIEQVLLYYQKFCTPNGPPMDLKTCALVISTAMAYCAYVSDPRGLSPTTVMKVLEKCGFKMEPLPESPMTTEIT